MATLYRLGATCVRECAHAMHTLLFRFSEVTTLRPTAQFTAMFADHSDSAASRAREHNGCLLGVRSVLSPPPPAGTVQKI